jgi:uncharacterized protein YjeT (DUF2065 family)
MYRDLWVALALVLVFEGILPFLSPRVARSTYRTLSEQHDSALRYGGLVSMLAGVALLYFVH